MNEIRHIHLGRQAYTIAADAYGELQKYLEAIRRKVGKEVADEVELRMSELLTERGITNEKVVLQADIAYLKEQLGTPGDFSDDTDDDEPEVETGDKPKRLFRDTTNAMVAGVAAGLSKYLDIDVVIIRIIFIALTFFGGSGAILYVILWLLVPEAKTNSERLQMNGLAVNVDNIKGVIERADVPGVARRATTTIGKVVRVVVRVVLGIVGVVLTVGGLGMLLGGAVATFYGLLRGLQVGNAALFPIGAEQVGVLVCVFVIVGLIAGMIITSGVALMRRKWSMPGWAIAAVIGTFIAAASVGTAFGFDVAPSVQQHYKDLQHSRYVSITPFTKIHFVGENMFYISEPGPTSEVEIRTFGKVDTSKIVVAEKDSVLTIDTSKFNPSRGCNMLCPFGVTNAEVIIHTPDNGANVSTDAAPGTRESIYGTGGVY